MYPRHPCLREFPDDRLSSVSYKMTKISVAKNCKEILRFHVGASKQI